MKILFRVAILLACATVATAAERRLATIPVAMPIGLMYKPPMTRKRTNPDFLNGVPELLILHLLSARPMYGYELVQAIRLETNATLEFGEGCVYPILHRLEADKLLASRRETVGGRNRVVYRVTTKGAKRLEESVAAWRHVVGAIQGVLQGGSHVGPAMA